MGPPKPNTPVLWERHKVVPRFYMNLRYRDRLFVDEEGDELGDEEEGDELADEHAVREHALDTARDLIAYARMNTIRNWGGY